MTTRLTARQAHANHQREFWRARNPHEWMAADAQFLAYMLRQEGRSLIRAEAHDDYARQIMGLTDADQLYA